MKNIFIYYIIFVNVINLISCKSEQKDENKLASDTLLAKTIVFPNKLFILDGVQFQKADSFLVEIKNKTKIVSIIDGNCMKCIINQLNKIDSTFNSILTDNNNQLIFILNVNKKDSAYFMHNMQAAIKATGVILWDKNYYFEKENNLFTSDPYLRTFMVGKKNKIIQYGNPIMNSDVIEEYKQKLK